MQFQSVIGQIFLHMKVVFAFINAGLPTKKAYWKLKNLQHWFPVFPRPNQAFWTLSALWSGWLWGRKGVTPMRSALSRRRYDWDWFAQAIRASFHSLAPGLIQDTPVFGLFSQSTPNFYLGLQTGMRTAGFECHRCSQPDWPMISSSAIGL